MSERLSQILQAVDRMTSTIDNSGATIEVPGLTQDEADVVAKTYSDRFRIVGPVVEDNGDALNIGAKGGYANAQLFLLWKDL